MAQYVFTMNRVSRIVPPRRAILKDISLSFFPGAKIGVLGLNVLRFDFIERFAPEIAGVTVMLCGIAIAFLGL